jgi:hypothetical protein
MGVRTEIRCRGFIVESRSSWRRSSFCFGGDCVELCRSAEFMSFRDSKNTGQKLDIAPSSGVQFLSWLVTGTGVR